MGVRIKSLKAVRWSLAGTLIIIGGGVVWFSVDRLAGSIFNRTRSGLEEKLSKPLGHPLLIGPYRGLRPWGISIGKTKLLPGFDDQSTATFSALTIKLAPLASLIKWRPVVIVRPEGAKLNLLPNQKGSYWVTGASEYEKPPKIDLRVRLLQPAKVLIEPSKLEITAIADASFGIAEREVAGSIQLGFPNRGSLLLKGKGFWNRLELRARARLKRVKLEPFEGILSAKTDFKAKGQLDGDFVLGFKEGLVDCQGDLTLADFVVSGGILKDALSSLKTNVSCQDKLLIVPTNEWKYGPWRALVRADLPLNKTGRLNLGVSSSLRLNEVNSSELKIEAKLPLLFDETGINVGDLLAELDLSPFPLISVGSLLGSSMSGTLSAKGQISGTFSDLNTNLSIGVVNPQFNGIRLQEEWRGKFVGLPGGGGDLQMSSTGAAVPGTLTARFLQNWSLENMTINRLGGRIFLEGSPRGFRWDAEGFRLDRVEVAIPPEKSFKRIFGELGGEGNVGINPISMDGRITLRYPRLMGLRLGEAQLKGNYLPSKKYTVQGEFFPPDMGKVSLNAEGLLGGRFLATAEVNGVSARWLTSTALQIPKINLNAPTASGDLKDLKGLFVESLGNSLDGQLKALAISQASLRKESQLNQEENVINPDKLRGKVDAKIKLEGPNLANLNLAINLSGGLWPEGMKDQLDLQIKPFVATLKGPLQGGVGEFSLINIPFALLSLVAPVPSSLQGVLGFSGRYKIGKGTTEVTADCVIKDARLAENSFVLERGKLFLSDSFLKIDLAMKSESSTETIKLIGQVPLNSSMPIDLRVESHGDGLRFLDGVTDGVVSWNKGTADFRLLVQGTFEDPKVNGFLVLKNGEFVVLEKSVKDLDSLMIFDFNRVEVQSFMARIGSKGVLRSSGAIALFNSEKEEDQPLLIEMSKVPLKLPVTDVEVESNLIVKDSLNKPRIGGDITFKEGFISPQRSGTGRKVALKNKSDSTFSGTIKSTRLPEQSWDLKEPLTLFVQDAKAPASKLLRDAIPTSFSKASFDDLRVRLGPNLRITNQPLADFKTSGLLKLNGSFDQSLSPSGVVRLTNGRVNLFTTTFNLDTSEPNVAVFSPSMGLIPYVDVKMTSRVSDTVRDASNLASSSDFATNGSGSFGIGGSRFVKVEVAAIGPADRLQDNFQLRSTPPMPRKQLLGLIGGNSFTRLLGGGEREVLANVLSRSLISPALGNITGAFSERLQISLYSAYVNSPEVVDESSDSQVASSEEASASLSPQQAWVAEMGIDLTDRFNFSVQTTPNRKDIPPQGTLTFQLNPSIDLLGSLDKNGTWQSELQMFVRF